MVSGAWLSPTATGVHIDATLATLCELATDDDFFVFDPDGQDERGNQVLAAVATCVKSGPLEGRRLELRTHATEVEADAKSLAYTRTDGLRGALTRGGMAEADIVLEAETEAGPAPAGAVGWPNERRVDIRIAPRLSR